MTTKTTKKVAKKVAKKKTSTVPFKIALKSVEGKWTWNIVVRSKSVAVATTAYRSQKVAEGAATKFLAMLGSKAKPTVAVA